MTVITDDFNRASLGSNYGSLAGYSTMAINASTVLRPGTVGGDCGNKYTATELATADQYAVAPININTSNASNSVWLLFRMPTGTTVTGYFVSMPRYGGTRQISKVVANSTTVLVSESDGTPTGSRELRGSVEGSTLKLFIDDVEELSTTDTSISSANRNVGIVGYYEAAGRWDMTSVEWGDIDTAVSTVGGHWGLKGY